MSEVANQIKHPLQGAFTIDAFNLINQHGDTINIQNIVTEFTLNESIYSKFCSATLAMSDGLNFPKNYRLTGQEFVHIVIKQIKESVEESGEETSKETTIDKLFRIYKIQSLSVQGQMTQNYVINLCEPRLFSCRRNRVSRVFRGSYNEILKKILVEEAKIPESNLEVAAGEYDGEKWEKTEPGNIQFISPNWTVGHLIDFCVNNASLGENTVYKNGMFFYQTLTGGFNFKSIDTMFKDETEDDLVFSQAPRNMAVVNAEGESADEASLDDRIGFNTQVFTITKPQLFDTLQGTVGGAYASKLISYDPIFQMTKEEVYDLEETWNRGPDKHLSGYPMIHTDGERIMELQDYFQCVDPATIPQDENLPPNKYPDSFVAYGNQMNHSYDNLPMTFPEVFKSASGGNQLERKAMLELLNQHRVVITIPLRTDLKVGTIIKVPQGPLEPSREGSSEDELNDMRYLITDIAVKGNPSLMKGIMDIECVKESFAKKITEANPLATASQVVSILEVEGDG